MPDNISDKKFQSWRGQNLYSKFENRIDKYLPSAIKNKST